MQMLASVRRLMPALFAAALTTAFADVARAQSLAWQPRAPIPVVTSRGGSAVVDRTLVALGGTTPTATGGFTATSLVQAYDADLDFWRELSPLPEPRFAFGCASHGGTVYLAGGAAATPPSPSASVLAYDVDGGGSVRPVGALLEPRMRTSAAVLDGKLYVVGGWGANGATLASVEQIDLATGAAVPMPPLPAGREIPGVAAFAGTLFVMGGHGPDGVPTDTCWSLRPPYGAWTECARLPFARAGGAEVAHGRILLPESVLAGTPPTAWAGEMLEYDPATDTWSSGGLLDRVRHGPVGVLQDRVYIAGTDDLTGAPMTEMAPLDEPPWPVLPLQLRPRMPTPRGGGMAALVDGRVVAIGGTSRNDPPPSGALATVEAYDVFASSWLELPPIHEPRFSAHGGAIGSVVYLAAGAAPGGTRADVLAYDPRSGTSWIDGPLQQPRFRHGAAAVGSVIYVVGGWDAGPLASVEAYDVAAHASRLVAPLPAPRDLPVVVALDGRVYVLGGLDASGLPATDAWVYDPALDAWSHLPPPPVAPGGASGVAAAGRIYVFGGSLGGGPAPSDLVDAVQVFDPAYGGWTVIGALDTFRWMVMAAPAGEEVLLIGGHDDSQALGLVEALHVGATAPPASSIEYPADGDALNLRDVVVSGTAWGEAGVAWVELSADGGASWTIASGTSQWTSLWQPPWEGEHVLLSRAVDAAGVAQPQPAVARVVVDWTAPSIEAVVEPPSATGWWNVPVTVRFVCSDALSGIASCPAPVVLSGDGAGQTASGTAWDRARNPATAHATVAIDRTPPDVTASFSSPANAAGWWNAPVTVSFACSDALSGVAACADPIALWSEAAGLQVQGWGTDVAENGAIVLATASLDFTAPLVAATPATPPNAAGWWNEPVTVAFTCSDALSGVASCPEPVTFPLDCAGCGVGGWATDLADNVGYGEVAVNVDLGAPVCTLAAAGALAPDGTYRSSVVVSVEASDGLSGVAAVEVDAGAGWTPYGGALVVGAPGTTVVSCRVTDVAGNVAYGMPLVIAIAPDGALAWTERPPLPVPATRAVAAVVDRTLYLLGGGGPDARVTAAVYAYDADAGAWRSMPPLPEPRASMAVATLGATVFLAGGAGSAPAQSTVVSYDVDTGLSKTFATLLTPRSRAGAAINAGKLYVAGGWAPSPYPGTALDSVEEIDLATGAAGAATPLPAPRQSPGVASYGGWLYVMGGLDAAGQPTDTCWKLRLAYPSGWTACATLPYPRWGEAIHGHGRILLTMNNVSAGVPPTAWTADVLAYDPTTDTWAVIGQKPMDVRGQAAGVIGDALYVAGGYVDGVATTFAASAPLHVPEWPPLPWRLRRHMLAPRAGAVPAVVDGRVVLLGGTTRNDTPPTGAVATVEAYDPAADTWWTLPPLVEPRYQSPGGAVNGVAYLAGGTTPNQPTRSDVLAYDVRTGASWIDGLLLEPRFRHGAAVLGGKIYVAGGRGTSALLTSVEAYDPATHASTPLAPLPGTRDMARVVAAGGRLFVLGGYETTPEPTMLEYDFASGAWLSHPPPPYAAGGAPAIAVGRNIVVLGGGRSGPAPTDLVEVVQLYDPVARQWTVLGGLDAFRFRATAAFLGGQLYFMGGDDGAAPVSLVEAFTIDGTPPTSAIASPADGSFTSARQLWVSGTAADDFGIQGVDVSDDLGATWSRASGRGTWSWSWLPLAEGEHVLWSRAVDSSGYPQDPPASARVTVDWTPPACVVSAAGTVGGGGIYVSDVIVTVAASDALSGVAAVEISAGGAPFPYAEPFVVSAEGPTSVSCVATDGAGNPGTGALSFTIDRLAPAIVETAPRDGDAGVATSASIAVTFGEPVLAGPAWSQVQVVQGKKVVAIAAAVSGGVVTLRPVAALDRGRAYTVSIPAGAVTDLAGNAFAGASGAPYRFSFTTAK